MAIFCGVITICASVLVNVGVRFHVRIEHGLVDTGVTAVGTLEGLGAKMVT